MTPSNSINAGIACCAAPDRMHLKRRKSSIDHLYYIYGYAFRVDLTNVKDRNFKFDIDIDY